MLKCSFDTDVSLPQEDTVKRRPSNSTHHPSIAATETGSIRIDELRALVSNSVSMRIIGLWLIKPLKLIFYAVISPTTNDVIVSHIVQRIAYF